MRALEKTWGFCKRMREEGTIVFTYVNDAFAEQLDTTPDDMIGKTDIDFNPSEEEVLKFQKADKAILDEGESRVIIQHETFTTRRGKTVHLRTIKEAVTLSNGERQLVGVAVDITDEVLLKEKLAFQAAVLDRVVNAFDNYIVIKGLDGKIVRCNQHFAQFRGFKSPGEAIARNHPDHWSEETGERIREDECREVGNILEEEPFVETLVSATGERLELLTWKFPIFSSTRPTEALAVLCISEILRSKGMGDANRKTRDRVTCLASLKQTKRVIEAALDGLIVTA